MDPKKLYVGNLPWSVNSDQLKQLFAEYGEVADAVVITDRMSGRSKGFGFVTYVNEDSAKAAEEGMNQKEIDGRKIVVNVARPREERPNRRFNRNQR